MDKVADLRITVVGDQIFCVRIESDSGLLDWRYDYDRLTYAWCDPHPELIEPVLFECNPNGQWGWLEDQTGAPITAAFADLLQGGT